MTALATKLLVMVMAFSLSCVRLNCWRRVDCDGAVALRFDVGFLRVFYCFGRCFCAGFICWDITHYDKYHRETVLRLWKAILNSTWSNDTEKGGFRQSWYTRIAIRKMLFTLSDKLHPKRTWGSLNLIFRPWPVRKMTSRIGDWSFFPTKLSNRYRYSTTLIITVKTAMIQPDNYYPISFSLYSYIDEEEPARLISVCCSEDFHGSCLDPDSLYLPRLPAEPHSRYGCFKNRTSSPFVLFFSKSRQESRTFRLSVGCIGRLSVH